MANSGKSITSMFRLFGILDLTLSKSGDQWQPEGAFLAIWATLQKNIFSDSIFYLKPTWPVRLCPFNSLVSILTIKMIYFICNFYFHSQFDGNISTTLINQFNPKKSIIDGVLRIQTCVCGMKGTFAGIYLVASLTIQNICIFLVHVLWRGQDSEQRVGAAHQDRDQPQDQGSFDAVHRQQQQQQQQGQMLQNIFDML